MTVNFIQLEYFHKVMTCGSVTRAARELFVTQPAVSKQLRLLEQELDCRLFQRCGNRFVPTPAGEFLDRRAGVLLTAFHNLPAELRSFVGEFAGPLRIGCGPYTSGAVVPELVSELMRRHPRIVPSVQERDSFLDDLRNGTLDIMFGIQGYHDDDLLYVPMYRNQLILICSEHSPLAQGGQITPERLASEPFLAHSYNPIRGIIFRQMPYLEKNRFRIESRYTTTLISYVQRNLGFSIIADCYLESLPPGVVAPSFDTGCEVESGFLVNPARPFSPPLRAMIALVREKYGCRPVPGAECSVGVVQSGKEEKR